jgi:type II secretory pathway pseudopilin PulG
MVADAVAGLALLAVLGTAIVVAVRSQQIASARLSDTRGATWAAEQALAQMQAGRPAGQEVRVEPLNAGGAPQGFAWVRVRTERNGRRADLTGLVPTTSVPAQGGQR